MAKLTEKQKAEIEALKAMSDDEIDLSDIPDRDIDWTTARRGYRGLSYRPVKQEITVTLDEYIINWFKENQPNEKSCHEAINEALMEYIRGKKFPSRNDSKQTAS